MPPFHRALAICLALSAASPALSFSPVGVWRCVQNSVVVSIDIVYRLSPDYSLIGEGSVTYLHNGRIVPIRAPGRWAMNSAGLVQMQVVPQNHFSFHISAAPANGDPNHLYDLRPNQSSGGMTETACQRIG